ncbi:MAG TPA: DUF4352 domain-containing protein [Chloroflexia bacterium]|nr:DUF4352 domain-containing protein [Chloroflexia bacterium]
MKKSKAIVLSLLMLALASLVLYACGSEPPTPTPPPPTNTVPPPTATTEPEAAPTEADTEASTPAAGRTRSPITSVRRTPTAGTQSGSLASADDVAMIKESARAADELKSYHFTMEVAASEFITQPVDAEGDFVAPDSTYIKGTAGGEEVEQLIVGGKVYRKAAGGDWVETEKPQTSPDDPTSAFNPESITTGGNPVQGFSDLIESVQEFRDQGEETINGVKVRHFTFDLDLAAMAGGDVAEVEKMFGGEIPPLGNGAVWIDPATKNMHRLDVHMDIGVLLKMMVEGLAQAFGGTPTPGGPAPTPFPTLDFDLSMTISKHNDPSVTVPDPPAGAMVATPEPTVGSASTPEAAPTTSSNTASGDMLPIGQTGQAGDFKVTVNKVTHTKQGTVAPDAGKEYVIVNLTVENISQEAKAFSTLLFLTLYDGANNKYDIALFGPDIEILETTIKNQNAEGRVDPGKSVTGDVAFEVADSATGLRLEYSSIFPEGKATFELDR